MDKDKNYTDYFYPDMAYTYEIVCASPTNINIAVLAALIAGAVIGHFVTRYYWKPV